MVPHLKEERSIVPYFTARRKTLKATSPTTQGDTTRLSLKLGNLDLLVGLIVRALRKIPYSLIAALHAGNLIFSLFNQRLAIHWCVIQMRSRKGVTL